MKQGSRVLLEAGGSQAGGYQLGLSNRDQWLGRNRNRWGIDLDTSLRRPRFEYSSSGHNEMSFVLLPPVVIIDLDTEDTAQ